MPHKLLLADDSVTIQRVIELTFADEDVQVIAVGDGRQAIDRIQTERPDIVLADVGMPERDGYEVAAFVKGHPEFSHVPVLLLTGAFEPIDEGRARAAGCDGVLVKPFEPQMVINRVKDLLAGKRPPGLWSAAPGAAQAPENEPADLALRDVPPPAAPPAATMARGGSLEDYFDRLDAVFADIDGQQAAAAPARAPEPPAEPPVGHRRTQTNGHRLTQTDTDALPQGPSLAEAFAALLAAEQGQPIAPAAVRPIDIPEATIDAIVQRVVERMGDDAVRAAVTDIAERLVREEIARIKRG